MKCATGILLLVLLFPANLFSQTGADCANAIPLTLDGVCRTFNASSSTDTSKICTNSIYSGYSPVTFFSFTTNSTPDRVLINITAPTADPMEVLMYSSPSCSPFLSSSSMCFDDGAGIWAASHNYTFLPNTTYRLRIKTISAGDITICASHYTPPNDNCSGALALSSTPITDNNACHTGGPGVIPADLCAASLENTAFYTFTVESTGVSIINLNNINCDNGNNNSSNGFQVGFFTGSCGSLTPLSCYSGSGSFISATTDILPAGTNVYVAVDGTAGTNCRYEINAINAVALVANLKNFAAWKKPSSNLLTWTSLREFRNDYFDIERSGNGRDFTAIGRVNGQLVSNSERNYEFNDASPFVKGYYRLKQVDKTGVVHYTNTLLVIRNRQSLLSINFQNPVTGPLLLNMDIAEAATIRVRIISMMGVVMKDELVRCQQGRTTINREISFLPAGNYLLEALTERERVSHLFIKSNH